METPKLEVGTPPYAPINIQLTFQSVRVPTPGQFVRALNPVKLEMPHRKFQRLVDLIERSSHDE